MQALHGFELLKETSIAELSSRVRYYRHVRTGAELLSVENDDENKSFGVGLLTPPWDSSGLPHILEHSVLAGSRKYPVKEPFVELLKTSVASFINAMTFPDMTVYPVASTNVKDFYNLIDVYLDAVFYPLITRETFQQEGWHYEGTTVDAPLSYKGVVFNEMKGYFSTPEFILSDEIKRVLMPDTPYANNSGGNPAVMPDLTYEAFQRFHETYYHPSNARFFFYGDDNPEERLRLVNAFIADFEAKDVNRTIPLQPRWGAPRSETVRVDAGEATADDNKGLMTVSWLLSDVTDTRTLMALNILNEVLIGTPASPLRKALIESGLGEDLTGGGLDMYARETAFVVGMKGIVATDAPAIEALILETLSTLADEGIDPAALESAINTLEFGLRERNTGRYPRGLAAFINVLPVWLHGGDPIDALAFEDKLASVKAELARNPRYFEELIGQMFLANPHRATLIMTPDVDVKTEREEAERQRLEAEKNAMSAQEVQAHIAAAERLKALQEASDDPDALAKLPVLALSDLDRKIKPIPVSVGDVDGTPFLRHDIGTSGIVYLDLAFDMLGLPAHVVPYVSLFSKALTEIGTQEETFVQFIQRIGAKTGGVDASPFVSLSVDRTRTIAKLVLRGKAMAGQAGDLLAIMRDVITNLQWDDKERLKQMVLEEKADMESYLGMIGHMLANYRLRGQFDAAGWFNEQNNGVSQLFFLRDLAQRIDSDWDGVRDTLQTMYRIVFNRANLLINATADAPILDALEPQLRDFVAGVPQAEPAPAQAWTVTHAPLYEGLGVPTQVNFVGKGANLYELGYSVTGAQNVVIGYLNMTHLWTKIRVQGGAYGGRLVFNPISGVATFLSWQDPNIVGTLANYDASAQFLRGLDLTQAELEKAIIGAIGDVDTYLLPDAKGLASMTNYLIGYTDDLRQRRRDEIFATTLADFHAFGDVLARMAEVGDVVIAGAPNALKEANAQLGDRLTVRQLQ